MGQVTRGNETDLNSKIDHSKRNEDFFKEITKVIKSIRPLSKKGELYLLQNKTDVKSFYKND